MTLTVQPVFAEDGYEIPLELKRDGLSVDPFATLVLPSGRETTGSWARTTWSATGSPSTCPAPGGC
jgi:hypothetical protein